MRSLVVQRNFWTGLYTCNHPPPEFPDFFVRFRSHIWFVVSLPVTFNSSSISFLYLTFSKNSLLLPTLVFTYISSTQIKLSIISTHTLQTTDSFSNYNVHSQISKTNVKHWISTRVVVTQYFSAIDVCFTVASEEVVQVTLKSDLPGRCGFKAKFWGDQLLGR